MAKTKPAKKTNGNAWWDQAVEVPRAGLPDAAKMNKRAKRLRRFVWAAVILCPISFLSVLLSYAGGGTAPLAGPTTVADRYADTKPTAIVAVREWLAGDPAPLPGGTFVNWNSATERTAPVAPNAPQGTVATVVESHLITVADSAGNLYDTTVAVGVTADDQPVLIGTPGLTPRMPASDSWDDSDWPGSVDVTVTAEMTAAVTAWSSAFTSGDPATLRLSIGDENTNRHYLPLNGAVLSDGQVSAAAGIFADGETEETGPSRAVVRATFSITWPTGSEETPDATGATVSYDLLLTKANTAAPKVVAWGGPGTGFALKPYSNAYAIEVVADAPAATEQDTTS